MDFAPLVEKKADRFRELEAAIAAPDFFSNPKKATEMMREHTRVKELLGEWTDYQKAQVELKESQELAKGSDAEMAEMAAAEIPQLEARIDHAEKQIQIFLLPPDAN
jgi:peptide chain release factor 1